MQKHKMDPSKEKSAAKAPVSGPEETVKMGRNRTGIATSPVDSPKMIEIAERTPPSPPDGEMDILENRERYIRESEGVGTVPPPGSIKGAVKAGVQKLSGRRPEVLIDKLSERLAFERTGVRLYDALISRCEAVSPENMPLPLDRIRQFRDEELRHFDLVRSVIERLGADPTAQSPCADISGVAAGGIVQVMTDPRSTISQALQGILIAELADNDSWELLIQLTEEAGLEDAAESFRGALQTEGVHLTEVRTWLQRLVLGQAGAIEEKVA